MELFFEEEAFDLGDLDVSPSARELFPSPPSEMTPSSLGLSGLMVTMPMMMQPKSTRPIETPMMTLILRERETRPFPCSSLEDFF